MSNKTPICLLLSFFLLLCGCRSAEKWYELGQYDKAIHKAIPKVLKDPIKFSSDLKVIQLSYQAAVQEGLDHIAALKRSGDPSIWTSVVEEYELLYLRDSALASLPTEIVRQICPSFPNYHDDLYNAKLKASAYLYALGKQYLDSASETQRQYARDAYKCFTKISTYFPTYKEVEELTKIAQKLGSIHILFRISDNRYWVNLPMQAQNVLFNINPSSLNNEWLHCYGGNNALNAIESGVEFQYVISLEITDIQLSPLKRESQNYISQKKKTVSVEINDSTTVQKEITIECEVNKFQESQICILYGHLELYNVSAQRTEYKSNLQANYPFVNVWAEIKGDPKALSPEDADLANWHPVYPPSPSTMIVNAAAKLAVETHKSIEYSIRNYIE
ncbi:MAG: hypothetical protein RR084_02620 [Bacteroidales bacterium]